MRRGMILFFTVLLWLLAYMVVSKEQELLDTVSLAEQMSEECSVKEVKTLLAEMKCFPVKQGDVTFENGYGGERSYGGNRQHEGIDIIPKEQLENTYEVLAAADGVVENIGWLELGGYRVGIRSEDGFYYYYAHLSAYQKGLKKGCTVKAGEKLGYMGNTGYGKEGTKGKFIIHLHFGMYHLVDGKDKSFNPYYLLQYVQG